MTNLNGSPQSTGTPAAKNIKAGLVGTPESKLKLMVFLAIVLVVVGFVYFTKKKDSSDQPQAEPSKVALSEVNLEADDVGEGAENPEVDALIAKVEADRQRAAINTGATYVAPVPVLQEQPEQSVVPPEVRAPTITHRVSYSSQQAKLAALQGLDERLYGAKPGIVTEVQFQKPESGKQVETTAQIAVDGASQGGSPADTKSSQQRSVKKDYPAGTTWFATTLTAINSDVVGPVKARIEQGPFAGGEALGSYEVRGRKYVTMTFTRVVHKGVEYTIDAVGTNPDNNIAGIEGDVNNHWGSRLLLPTLAAAVGRYAEAATFGGVTTISSGGAVVQQPELSDSEQLRYALGTGVSEGIRPVIQQEAGQIQRTVTLPQYTTFGLMLVEGI